MYKYYLIIATILLVSCKENKKDNNIESDTETYEAEYDPYQPTDEELEQLRIDDSINIARNRAILEKESILKKNGSYTKSDDIVSLLIKLGFLSPFKANSIELKEIVPDPNSDGDTYLKSCIYKTNTTIEFFSSFNGEMKGDNPNPTVITSNLDSEYYYVEKVTISKEGGEIEIGLKYMTPHGNVSNKGEKPFMVYMYDYYVLEFYDDSFAAQSIVDSLMVEECDEPERG